MKRLFSLCLFIALLFSGPKTAPATKDGEPSGAAISPPAAEDIVSSVLSSMTTDEKIYQLFFVAPESLTGVGTATAAGDATRDALARYPVGGIIYFSNNFIDREQTRSMIASSQSYSKIPLFIGVDEEGGIVSRLGSKNSMGTTKHPPMRDIGKAGDPEKARAVGQTLGTELSALGFNLDFAPDADVLVNPNNSEIGNRSFGSDPELVSDMVAAVVSGMRSCGVLPVLKHFPGHGSTGANSHNGFSESLRTVDQLRSCEFLPFIAGINAGADIVMVSHMTLSSATTEDVPSTLSREVVTDFLRTELGYTGIVITDAFNMGAITKNYTADDAITRALGAGVDMILMPQNVRAAHDTVLNALHSGALTEERLDESVRRILTVKYRAGLLS